MREAEHIRIGQLHGMIDAHRPGHVDPERAKLLMSLIPRGLLGLTISLEYIAAEFPGW
jgi:hypothetical protein